MRNLMILAAVAALPLAACGAEKSAKTTESTELSSSGYEPVSHEDVVQERFASIERDFGITEAEYRSMSDEERERVFAPDTGVQYEMAKAGLLGEFKPIVDAN